MNNNSNNSFNNTFIDQNEVGEGTEENWEKSVDGQRKKLDSLIVIGITLLVVVIVIDTVVRIITVCKMRKHKRTVKPLEDQQQQQQQQMNNEQAIEQDDGDGDGDDDDNI
jgi:hypothetical protein